MKSTAHIVAATAWVLGLFFNGQVLAQSAGLEFFEKKIRPVLVEKCHSCHSADAKPVKGGLRVDSRDLIRKGGDSGPAVVPGNLPDSLLIKAIEHAPDFYEMPPDGKLPNDVLADFRRWIEMGAPDPRDGNAVTRPSSKTIEAAGWWSLKSRSRPSMPDVVQPEWCKTPVDFFVLARQDSAQLRPNPDASRETLARRLWLDLVGLPIPGDDLDAFIQCPDEDFEAFFEQQVDRLLAAPQFGERWGRHWLDVFRFAESSGGGRTLMFHDAWRFRDYMVEAMNSDRSMREIIREQIAGDLLPTESLFEQRRRIVATGFLALGPTNYERQDKDILEFDVVDEQMDEIGRAYLGMTIGCARCHDHKFDPIPTREYYAMAGILRSSLTLIHENVSKWVDTPLPVDATLQKEITSHEAQLADLNARILAIKQQAKISTSGSASPNSNVLSAHQVAGIVVDDSQAKAVGQWKLSTFNKRYVGDGYLHDENRDQGKKTLTFVPQFPTSGRYEVRFSYQEGSNRATNAKITVFHADGEQQVVVNQQDVPTIDGRFISLGEFRFETSGQGFVLVSNEGANGHVIADAVQFLPVGSEVLAAKTSASTAKSDAGNVAATDASRVGDRSAAAADELKRLDKELKRLTQVGPKREVAMSVREHERIEDCSILIRGNVATKGPVVPRGVLSLGHVIPLAPVGSKESGRRQLADWLTHDQLPLPPRVLANRVWHWIIGVGIVRSTDNFGVTGEAPSHPELLDYLAERFVENDWSVKQLVREVVVSRSYRMSSSVVGPGPKVDPENRLLWRAHRRRIDAEVIRDTMLANAGQLDLRQGGSSIDPKLAIEYDFEFTDNRRSIYTPVFRNKLLRIFEALDFADPNQGVGARNDSTTSTQALYFMNDPFPIEQSRLAASRLLAMSDLEEDQRIMEAYRSTLARFPTSSEILLILEHLRNVSPNDESERLQAWAMVFQSLFASVEFRYLN